MGAPASGGGAQRKRKKREERKAQAERDKQKRMAKTGREILRMRRGVMWGRHGPAP